MAVSASRRPIWAFLGAAALFGLALFISRLTDLGLVPGEDFGAGDWKRRPVEADLLTMSGESLHSGSTVSAGERLMVRYQRTRYPYLWVLDVGADGRLSPILPRVAEGSKRWGLGTAHKGETINEPALVPTAAGDRVWLLLFTPIPRRLDELQAAADAVEAREATAIAQEMDIAGQRFVYRLAVRTSTVVAP